MCFRLNLLEGFPASGGGGAGGGGEILFAMISGYQCESTKIGFDIKSAEIGFNKRPTLSRDLVCTQWAADRRPGWTGAGSVSNNLPLDFYSTIKI